MKVLTSAFAALQVIATGLPPSLRVGREQARALFTEQMLLLRRDEDRAIAALPRLLPPPGPARETLLGAIRKIVAARGELSGEERQRLARIEALFESPQEPPRPEAAEMAAE